MAIFKNAVPMVRVGFMCSTFAARYLNACFTIETADCTTTTDGQTDHFENVRHESVHVHLAAKTT